MLYCCTLQPYNRSLCNTFIVNVLCMYEITAQMMRFRFGGEKDGVGLYEYGIFVVNKLCK